MQLINSTVIRELSTNFFFRELISGTYIWGLITGGLISRAYIQGYILSHGAYIWGIISGGVYLGAYIWGLLSGGIYLGGLYLGGLYPGYVQLGAYI